MYHFSIVKTDQSVTVLLFIPIQSAVVKILSDEAISELECLTDLQQDLEPSNSQKK